MEEKILKIGNTEIALRDEGSHFSPKNKRVLLDSFVEEIRSEWSDNRTLIYQQMLENPTLFLENSLVGLNKMENNLFEVKDIDVLFDILVHSKSDMLDEYLGGDFNVGIKKEREEKYKQGELAIIVPFFNAHVNPKMVENFNIFRAALRHHHIFVAEVAFGNMDFIFPESESFLRIRGGEKTMMWQKERILNLALEKLPKEYTNVAWIDADILFDREDWIQATKDKLDDFAFVQMFDTVQWMGPNGDSQMFFHSIVKRNTPGTEGLQEGKPYGYHPGFAWAARREVLEEVKFFDQHIAGNGDSYIFYGIIGNLNCWNYQMVRKLLGFNYCFLKYRQHMKDTCDGSVSFLEGNIKHLWHGDYKDRNYTGRQEILIHNKFDPLQDLFINDDGLYEWNYESGNAVKIHKQLLEYFKQR